MKSKYRIIYGGRQVGKTLANQSYRDFYNMAYTRAFNLNNALWYWTY